eukprot:m.40802 g.40802  ORF g.40802 m.40802 type:complete len:446 (-) comp18619_c0_seq1:54-1391(-)
MLRLRFLWVLSLCLFERVCVTNGLDNGVSPLPPLGWSSWNGMHADIDEVKIRAQVDAMVSTGMRDAGYVYINIDDMWAENYRAANGSLVPDKKKFPSGMFALSEYIHSHGLKFGLYTDVGTNTCGGQPGSFGYECVDANQFAAWGVDWLKEDHCNLPHNTSDIDGFYNTALAKMRDCLNATGRPIHFDLCAHTCYDTDEKKHSPACWDQWYANATALGNSWRTTTDINSGWKSVLNNLYRNNMFANQLALAQFNGPHHWNDPDSLEVGSGTLTVDQERLHFSMWALMAAPLITGNLLDQMNNQTLSILTHPGLLKINQDALGMQAIRIEHFGARINFSDVYGDPLTRWEQEVWAKPLLLYPGQYQPYGFALALINHATTSVRVEASMAAVAKVFPKYYDSTAMMDSLELWSDKDAGDVSGIDAVVDWTVAPSGVAVIRLDPDCSQ